MQIQTFDDVFDALANTPAEAANLKARADLLSSLVAYVRSWELPPTAAAQQLAVTRPQLDDLLQGKLDKFSLEALVDLTVAAGLTLNIRGSDESRPTARPST